MRWLWLVVLVGCSADPMTLAGNQGKLPAWRTHPECAHEYDAEGRTVAAYCPSPTGYR